MDEKGVTHMPRGTRSKLVGLLAGGMLLLGAAGAYAAPVSQGAHGVQETARWRDGRHPGRGDHGHRHVIFGEITETNKRSFSLETRWGEVKVRWDSDTKFKGGDSDDLDEGTVVGVVGDRTGHKRVDADVIFFPKHDHHRDK